MAKQKKIGVGIIGLGFMGRTHLAAFNRSPHCEVVAIADRDGSRLTGENGDSGNFETGGSDGVFDPGTTSTFEDAMELIDHSDVEAVSITTPTPTHHALALAVLRSGRHLLVEKPVDLDPNVILQIAEAAREVGVLAMPAHCMRFWPAWIWMKRQIDEKKYGDVCRASFTRVGPAPGWNPEFYLDEEKSGGAIVDLHIHDTDFIIHCFGIPQSVQSRGSRRLVKTAYEFDSGLEVVAEGGWIEAPDVPFTMRVAIECEKATMKFDLGTDPEITVEHNGGIREDHPEASLGGSGYDGQIQAFLGSIRRGDSFPPVTLLEAADTARVLEAEIRSVDSGGARISMSSQSHEL